MNIDYAQTKYGEIAVYSNDFNIRECLIQWGLVPDQAVIEQALAGFIKASSVILDIGAHVGCHSLAYSQINPNAQIYAFEPQGKIFELLERNINHNGGNIQAFNKAVGPVSGHVEMATYPSDGPTTGVAVEYGTDVDFNLGGLSVGLGGESVEMCSIDDMNLDCQFIKIDAEGFESYVLVGLADTIQRCWPVIFYEQNYKTATGDMKSRFGEMGSATEILNGYGYNIHSLPCDNYLAIR